MIKYIRRYRNRTTRKALRVCDGVIEIANNEMLVHGTFVTQNVVNEELKQRRTICGGRAACLIGSMYLAHGDMPAKPKGSRPGVWDGIFSRELRYEWIGQRPALQLAYDAFNQAAKNIVDAEHSEWSNSNPSAGPYMDWAEFYFEEILGQGGNDDRQEYRVAPDGTELRIPYLDTRVEVIRVANDAKHLIRSGVVS